MSRERQGFKREPPPICKAPRLPQANHMRGWAWLRGSSHLVTRAEMMSVMVALTSASISSTGPGMGSCWQRCSALRICCRFCQMISANFSHLHPSPGAKRKDRPSHLPRPKVKRLQAGLSPQDPAPLTQEGFAPQHPLLPTEQSRTGAAPTSRDTDTQEA